MIIEDKKIRSSFQTNIINIYSFENHQDEGGFPLDHLKPTFRHRAHGPDHHPDGVIGQRRTGTRGHDRTSQTFDVSP